MPLIALTEQHYSAVAQIYLEGIATGQATFETSAPDWDTWNQNHLAYGRWVMCSEEDNVIGWAALSPVSGRCVYAGVAEVSEYVSEQHRGKGVGKFLLQKIIADSEAHGIWTLQAGVFPENKISLALHQRCGFREVGHREKIGKMNGIWRDTVLLERRSKTIGL